MNVTSALAVLAFFVQVSPGPIAQRKPKLLLEARLVSIDYCRRPPSDEVSVELYLRLKFTNKGDDALILYRECDYPVRNRVSATASDALAGRYERDGIISYGLVFPHLISGKEKFPPQDYFVILNPGESYFLNHISGLVGLRICMPARQGCPGLAGTHYLHDVFRTWGEWPGLVEPLRKRWWPFGMLWDADVVMEPLPFTVSEQPEIRECAPIIYPSAR